MGRLAAGRGVQAASLEADGAAPVTRKWWIRMGLMGGVTAAAVVAGLLFHRFFLAGPERDLAHGEKALTAGQKAAHAKRWEEARSLYAEAIKLADKVLAATQPEQEEESTPKQKYLQGKACWLKARALCYRARAERQLELPGIRADGTTTRLDVGVITDARTSDECLRNLVAAIDMLPGDEAVQCEGLRNFFDAGPKRWNWPAVTRLARNVLALQPAPADKEFIARAHFVLAYEALLQPQSQGYGADARMVPTPAERRKRDVLLTGLAEIAKLRAVEDPLRFRSLFLEAELRRLLALSYRRSAPFLPAEAAKQEQALRALLFDPPHGSVSRLQRERGQKSAGSLSPMDIEGLFGLQSMALEQLREDAKASGAGSKGAAEQSLAILDDLRAVARQIITQGDVNKRRHLFEAAAGLAGAARTALPLLAVANEQTRWRELLDEVQKLAADALERTQSAPPATPDLYVALAELLLDEAAAARDQRMDSARAKELLGQADGWVARGLADLEKQQVVAAAAQPLHRLRSRIRQAGR